jgi:hypothetical protein
MLRQSAFFITLTLVIACHLEHAAAQEGSPGEGDITWAPQMGMEAGQGGHIPLGVSNVGSHGRPNGPLVVLPVPLPLGRLGGTGSSGPHYPGSYMPPDTPLHRFNGYIVCDPPHNISGSAETYSAGAMAKPSGKSVSPRLVKITSTRPLSAPEYRQPCPTYTIDGRIQKNNGQPAKPER